MPQNKKANFSNSLTNTYFFWGEKNKSVHFLALRGKPQTHFSVLAFLDTEAIQIWF